MAVVGQIYSFGSSQIENIRFRTLINGSATENISFTLSFNSNIRSITSGVNGLTEWVFVPNIINITLGIFVPETAINEAFNESVNIAFTNGVYDINLTGAICYIPTTNNLFNFLPSFDLVHSNYSDLSTRIFNKCVILNSSDYFPNAFVLEEKNRANIFLTKNEEFSYQFNFSTPKTVTPSDIDISIISCSPELSKVDNFTTLNSYEVNTGEYIFYFTWIPNEEITEGGYCFLLRNTVTDEVISLVSPFYYIEDQEFLIENTVHLDYRNSTDRNGFLYSGDANLLAFRNKVRVRFAKIANTPEYEQEEPYFEQTTGKTRIQKTRQRKAFTLEGQDFSEYENDAAFALSNHDDILIDGKKIEVKSGYQEEIRRRSSNSRGVMEVYDTRYDETTVHGV